MKIFTCLNINDVRKYFSISSSMLDIVRVPEEVAREMLSNLSDSPTLKQIRKYSEGLLFLTE